MGYRLDGHRVPEEAVSLQAEAHGGPVSDATLPAPVGAWIGHQTREGGAFSTPLGYPLTPIG